MPWSSYSPATRAHSLELCSPATRAYALEYIYAHSDEGLCPGLVPHAYKMLGLHSQVRLSSRLKMSMMMNCDDVMMLSDMFYMMML